MPHGPSVNTLRLCYLHVPTLFGIGYPFYNVLSFREISNVSVKENVYSNKPFVCCIVIEQMRRKANSFVFHAKEQKTLGNCSSE